MRLPRNQAEKEPVQNFVAKRIEAIKKDLEKDLSGLTDEQGYVCLLNLVSNMCGMTFSMYFEDLDEEVKESFAAHFFEDVKKATKIMVSMQNGR